MRVTCKAVTIEEDPAEHYISDCDVIVGPGSPRRYMFVVTMDLNKVIAIDTANGMRTLESGLNDTDEVIDRIVEEVLKATKRFLLQQRATEYGLDDDMVDIMEI